MTITKRSGGRPKGPVSTYETAGAGAVLMAATFLATALAVAVPAAAEAAQFNATVRGKVVDADGNALEGVSVTVGSKDFTEMAQYRLSFDDLRARRVGLEAQAQRGEIV